MDNLNLKWVNLNSKDNFNFRDSLNPKDNQYTDNLKWDNPKASRYTDNLNLRLILN